MDKGKKLSWPSDRKATCEETDTQELKPYVPAQSQATVREGWYWRKQWMRSKIFRPGRNRETIEDNAIKALTAPEGGIIDKRMYSMTTQRCQILQGTGITAEIFLYTVYIYTVYIDMFIYSRIVYQKQKTKRQDKDIREILENRSGRHITAADAVSKSWEIHATIETNILKRRKGTALKLNNRKTKI